MVINRDDLSHKPLSTDTYWLLNFDSPLPLREGAREMEISHKTQCARILRNNMTDAERFLWQQLRRKQVNGYKFRRQIPLGKFIVDFVCLEAKLVIELDGGQHAEQGVYDALRDTWSKEQGFRVLRFWNDEVFQNTDGVLEVIVAGLEGTSPPGPPPQGEGG